MGRAKASVLPEPVLAIPTQSRPDRMGGMQEICTGVGFLIPIYKKKEMNWKEYQENQSSNNSSVVNTDLNLIPIDKNIFYGLKKIMLRT